VVSTLRLDKDRMAAALSPDMFATDLADYLVRKGVAFRSAHDMVGSVVRRAEELGKPLQSLSVAELRPISREFGDDVAEVFDVRAALERRNSPGGTAKRALERQLELARTSLE
jgi:argininosuccinate lyase